MKNHFFLFLGFVPKGISAQQIVMPKECYMLAERNYPLARKAYLLKEKINSEKKILEKEILPKSDLTLRASYQSDIDGNRGI